MNDPNKVGRDATVLANLAEWRIRALLAVSRGMTHLKAAYDGNDAATEEIEKIRELFFAFYDFRIEKLKTIAAKNREIAAREIEKLNA